MAVKSALLSAFDRTGLPAFARVLADAGYRLISTGGTSRALRDAGLAITEVAELTGAAEILGGRVKTLHPKIHGGLLARRSDPNHMTELAEQGVETIDIVVNNLYPFVETVARPDVALEDALENIDIGGPAMTRAAAKNFPDVVIVVDPGDYDRVGEMIRAGDVPLAERRRLAAKAFQHVAAYDTAIVHYLRGDAAEGADLMGKELTFGFDQVARPRYGENPHQAAGIYARTGETGGIVNARQLHGIEMSYLNYLDGDAAWVAANSFNDFAEHTAVVVKHANPCGLAVNEDQAAAWSRALAGDPVSAFGGIAGFNRTVSAETARAMKGVLLDVIVAPEYEPDALELLRKRKRTRILQIAPNRRFPLVVRSVTGGALVQQPDELIEDPDAWQVITRRGPTATERADLVFAWRSCRLIKSNAIVFAKDRRLTGMGAGQPNRVGSVFLACRVAQTEAQGSVMASDAFFPFPDGVEQAAEQGITAVAQPGGSVRDGDVIAAADRLGLSMVLTGVRHFLH